MNKRPVKKIVSQEQSALKKLQKIAQLCGFRLPSHFDEDLIETMLVQNSSLRELSNLDDKIIEKIALMEDDGKKQLQKTLEEICVNSRK